MARRIDGLRRRRPSREVKRRILIVCEGEVTEAKYFNDLRHQTRSLVELSIRPGGTPKTLVERAADLKQTAEKSARRGKDENLKYDVAWCVFDVDEHPFLAEAQQQARANGIKVAVSNPCFELGQFCTIRINMPTSIDMRFSGCVGAIFHGMRKGYPWRR